MARMQERVFTDADFDNRVHNKAKPGEIWAKVNELSEMFESVKDEKNNKNRRMNENIMSYNGRPRTSFNQVQEAADVVEINGVKYKKLNESKDIIEVDGVKYQRLNESKKKSKNALKESGYTGKLYCDDYGDVYSDGGKSQAMESDPEDVAEFTVKELFCNMAGQGEELFDSSMVGPVEAYETKGHGLRFEAKIEDPELVQRIVDTWDNYTDIKCEALNDHTVHNTEYFRDGNSYIPEAKYIDNDDVFTLS